MKKWISLLLGGVVAFGISASAFATGNGAGASLNVTGNAEATVIRTVDGVTANQQGNATVNVTIGGKVYEVNEQKLNALLNGEAHAAVEITIDGKVYDINAKKLHALLAGTAADADLDIKIDGKAKVLKAKELLDLLNAQANAVIKVTIDGKVSEITIPQLLALLNAQADAAVKVVFCGQEYALDAKKLQDVLNAHVTLDGLIDPAWYNAEIASFVDAATGLQGNYRLMWDEDNLYVLVEVDGAAKLWKDKKEGFMFSLFYNGDDDDAVVKGNGHVVVSWPDLKVHDDNGLHLGWFKNKKLVKSFAVKGDDVVLELKLPWEQKDGIKLSKETVLGIWLGLKGIQADVDANGVVTFPVLTDLDISKLTPSVIAQIKLQLMASLINTGAVQGNVDVNVGCTVNTGGTGGTGGTSDTGGTGGSGGTGTGGTTPTGGTGTDTGSNGGSGGLVAGVSDENTGVVPGGMPQTGGGGASEWTD